jgi:hypothetical protein
VWQFNLLLQILDDGRVTDSQVRLGIVCGSCWWLWGSLQQPAQLQNFAYSVTAVSLTAMYAVGYTTQLCNPLTLVQRHAVQAPRQCVKF